MSPIKENNTETLKEDFYMTKSKLLTPNVLNVKGVPFGFSNG